MLLNSLFPRLQVGGRNQIQRLHLEEHLIKQHPFYPCALILQHQKMLDFFVEIQFVDSIGRLLSAAGCLQETKDKNLCKSRNYLWGQGDRPAASVLIRSAVSEF